MPEGPLPKLPLGVLHRQAMDHIELQLADHVRQTRNVRDGVRLGVAVATLVGVGALFIGLQVGSPTLLITGAVALVVAAAGWVAGRALRPEALASLDTIRVDGLGVRINQTSLGWAEIVDIAVLPYPYVDQSFVYCVVIATESEVVRVGAGTDQGELDALAAYLRAVCDRHQAGAAADRARTEQQRRALDDLDTLIGRQEPGEER